MVFSRIEEQSVSRREIVEPLSSIRERAEGLLDRSGEVKRIGWSDLVEMAFLPYSFRYVELEVDGFTDSNDGQNDQVPVKGKIKTDPNRLSAINLSKATIVIDVEMFGEKISYVLKSDPLESYSMTDTPDEGITKGDPESCLEVGEFFDWVEEQLAE